SSYGGVVAAPVFRGIADAVLRRLGVESEAPMVQPAAVRAVPAGTRVVPRTVSARDLPATPSFLGLSRREALARARASGWDVEVTGVGYVHEQVPPPGSPLAPDRRLALRLVPAGAGATTSQ